MGDAADQSMDMAMDQWLDFSLMLQSVRDHCQHPNRACRLVDVAYEDDDDWLPYQCTVCRDKFDFP